MDPQTQALLDALTKLGTLGDQQGLYGQQQQQNQSYMQPQSGQHSTGIGAALGGLGDMVRGGVGAYRQKGLNEQQQGVLGQQGKARGDYLQALIQSLRGGGQPMGGGPVDMNAPPDPMAVASMNGGGGRPGQPWGVFDVGGSPPFR